MPDKCKRYAEEFPHTDIRTVTAQPLRDTRGDGGDEARRFARKRPYVWFRIVLIDFYCEQGVGAMSSSPTPSPVYPIKAEL